MDVARHRDLSLSFSNRQLYVARSRANRGRLHSVRVRVRSKFSPYLLEVKYDVRLGRAATKWERSFSTTCVGQ